MSAAANICGYVEATTATRVLGWAWAPRAPTQRLIVQALLGETVIAEAPADRPREDLARNGIGDGRHAFELDLPDAARERLAELCIVVRTEEGAAIRLGTPPEPESTADRLDRLQRGVDALVASQRLLHRNLQAALTAPRTGDAPVDIAAMQEQLGKQMVTIELFAMRLDERLAALTPPPQPDAAPAEGWWRAHGTTLAFALAALSLILSLIGLWRQLP